MRFDENVSVALKLSLNALLYLIGQSVRGIKKVINTPLRASS